MGAKPIFPFRFSSRSVGKRFGALALASALACGLFACISDGPNQTGGEYLNKHGILFRDSLYHVVLKGMPVDSFWTLDAELNHLGDTILLAGHSGDFTAEPRFAFQVTDTAMLDSLDEADSSTLKLSLGFPLPVFAFEELKATVNDSLKKSQDSIRFLVSAWDTTDNGLSSDAWNILIPQSNRQYLDRGDTVAALPAPSTTDTITVAVKNAYAQVSQSKPLPHLHGRLRASMSHRHLIQLRMSPLFDSTIDSGSAMLRLGGHQGDGSGLVYEPLLLFGKRDSATGSTAANRLQAILVATQRQGVRRGVDYSLRYSGPVENIVPAKRRGLHLILNRKALIDSIDADLVRQGKTPQPRSISGDFDVTYFVPFAKMTLPLAGSELEGGFPLQMNLVSSKDSLLGNETTGAIQVDVIPTNLAVPLWQTTEPGNPGKIVNEVSLLYRTVDNNLRRVELTYSKDTGLNDTIYIAPGDTAQMVVTLPGTNSANPLTLKLEASEELLTVRSYLTVSAGTEPDEFRDPATGERITDIAKRVQKFLQPGQTQLTLRATNGIQRMLNQVQSNARFLPDFQVQSAVSPAYDTTVDLGSGNTAAAVPYPVLSVVSPKLEGDSLKVDVELYLFPLKAR